MINAKYFLPAAVALLGLALGVAVLFNPAASQAARDWLTATDSGHQTAFTMLSATTTNATSTNTVDGGGYYVVAGAEDVTLYFTRTQLSGSSGNTTFKVQVTPDGATWYDFNELAEVGQAGDANAFFARTGTSTLTGTTTKMFILDNTGFYALRCIAVRVTDGEASCRASAKF